MKILVFSDSHASLLQMRKCIAKLSPDVVIHLGDYFDDGLAVAEENPFVRFYQVPGNCDHYRPAAYGQPEIWATDIGGVRFYLTHGHKHGVKLGLYRLLRDARAADAKAVLYGHTHIADCHREEDGLWVLNPGSCGSFGGGAGVILVENGNIEKCYLLNFSDLEVLS